MTTKAHRDALREHEEWLASFAPIDLGDEHRAGWWERDLNDGRGKVRDLAWVHRCTMPNGERRLMLGSIDVTTGERHRLVSEDPLHVEPSIACRACSDRGFVRDGKWVRA